MPQGRAEPVGRFLAPREDRLPEPPGRRRRWARVRAPRLSQEASGAEARSPSATARAFAQQLPAECHESHSGALQCPQPEHRGVPAPAGALAHSGPELGPALAAGGLTPDMADKDRCGAGNVRPAKPTLPARAQALNPPLRRLQSMRKKSTYSSLEVFCKHRRPEAWVRGGRQGQQGGQVQEDPGYLQKQEVSLLAHQPSSRCPHCHGPSSRVPGPHTKAMGRSAEHRQS